MLRFSGQVGSFLTNLRENCADGSFDRLSIEFPSSYDASAEAVSGRAISSLAISVFSLTLCQRQGAMKSAFSRRLFLDRKSACHLEWWCSKEDGRKRTEGL
ncbi:MAG: hypothetical protein C4334_14180 [Pyrinomonas sp.]